MVTICGRNSDEMFFLTRDGDIEITSYGYPKLEDGSLYYYADQVWLGGGQIPDNFGRNQIDIQFIRLCHILSICLQEETFKSLSCKKVGEKYIARLELTDETLEMALAEMVALFEKRWCCQCKVHNKVWVGAHSQRRC